MGFATDRGFQKRFSVVIAIGGTTETDSKTAAVCHGQERISNHLIIDAARGRAINLGCKTIRTCLLTGYHLICSVLSI